MIISCPSCQASFRVDTARIGPDGKKVRCSKCGNVWHALPDRIAEPKLAATEEAGPAGPAASPGMETEAPARAEPPKPAFTARHADDEDLDSGAPQEPAEDEEPDGGDGLTGEQRAKLAAARARKQPRGVRFWIKILLIFIVVVGFLLVAQKMGMVPSPGPKKAGPAVEQPASDVGPVDTKPAQADSEAGQQGGHIVGGPLPGESNQPAK